MLYQSSLFLNLKQFILLIKKFPYISLLIWLIPLLLFTSGQTSLMAHDEALYARRARLIFDSGDWIAPWGNAHHKTPGFYWLIAIFYKLFGVSDISARIPSMIAGIISALIIYEIAKILLGEKLAYLSTAILSVEFIWLQYCRLTAPDVPTILLVCLGILCLLKSEINPRYRLIYGFIAGVSFGLGFLMRSFMIFLPMVALFPYLIGEHRRHHHLINPMLYLGGLVGLIPTLVWLWFNWLRYGGDSVGQLLGFVAELGSSERPGNGIFYYFWNVPLKSFPWFFCSILGLVLVIRKPILRYQLLLVGFPITLFTEITIFSTRLAHYSLCLYPFMAMLAAVGLDWLANIYQQGKITQIKAYIPRNISYAFGVLGIILILASIVVLIAGFVDIQKYTILALISGLACLIVPLIWILRYRFGQNFLTARYWIGGWLIAIWISLATAGSLGLLGDFNPAFRIFFQQESIAAILQQHPVNFVNLDGKNAVLINFYTPIHGQEVESISQLPALSYAWIYQPNSDNLSKKYRILGTIKDYQLIQILSF
ncbi:glycosyltransferase family 39 protein [Sphaerospermopsis aphanizomenoides BCCUSP55]|uniref:ArnT family glycosyltransferase n=1 Tax=Sphaerospermopsis aphanizomenoides TaxID=459663 RepID=UPI0019073242|nr:glycosyltransferase family 39 protein [Sphaerospermopsis aphanizomenoides]MBK1986131.1 glycosyltransferase family 39 protein [Sphaerospermopsis aphanizomenoides BCCUSP55]